MSFQYFSFDFPGENNSESGPINGTIQIYAKNYTITVTNDTSTMPTMKPITNLDMGGGFFTGTGFFDWFNNNITIPEPVINEPGGFFKNTGNFFNDNWAWFTSFASQQREAIRRNAEKVRLSVYDHPATAAAILSIMIAIILLIVFALLLKYRRKSSESRPLLCEQGFSNGKDEMPIENVESQRIQEMRKKMQRKSLSRFSVDFDRFNADIHQCSSGSQNDNDKTSQRENSSDEIK